MLIESLRQAQLAGWIAEPPQNQNHRHQRPGNLFPAAAQALFQETIQFKLPQQCPAQPRAAESPRPLYTYTLQIDFHPLRLARLYKQVCLLATLRPGEALDPQPPPSSIAPSQATMR